MVNSIWADIYYTTTADTLDYYVECETGTIFRGRAYKFPQADVLRININSICRDYLSNTLPDFRASEDVMVRHTDSYKTFNLVEAGTEEVLATYTFVFNWDYENNIYSDETPIPLTKPIDGCFDPRMKLFFSYFSSSSAMIGGTEIAEGVSTYIRRAYDTESPISFGQISYDRKRCGDYALYYQGENGGWNSYLIQGKVIEKDGVEAHYYNKTYDNTSIEFERGRYIAEIAKTFELHSGFLTDTQAENLSKNLLSSNIVYLHRLSDDKIMPVVIENKEITYRKFANEKRLISYQIDVRCSQTRIRR